MKTWKIYMHKNKINGKVYIGQTYQTVEDRWKNGKGYTTCVKFNRAIEKYGWDNFEHVVLVKDISTQEEADRLECYWIEYYNSINDGYNIAEGGSNGSNIAGYSEEELEAYSKKCSEAHKLSYKNHPEIKKKISASTSGANNPMYKKDWREGKTEEELLEIRRRESEIAKNRCKDVEYRKKLSRDRMGSKNGNAKKVICVTTGVIFNTIKEGASYYNISGTHIGDCCKGKVKWSGKLSDGTKLVWRYVGDDK